MMDRKTLIDRIKSVAYLEGDFTLSSGKKSRYYLDKYRFETQPDILAALGQELAKHTDSHTTCIAGPELGAIALAAAASMAANLPFVIVRKTQKVHGTANLIEGVLSKRDRVLLVEDIATTGAQAIAAARVIREAGADVQRIVAVIDRLEGAREAVEQAGFEFAAILTREDLGIGS